MSLAGSVANGVHGALLLARGKVDGLRYVEADMAGAARSFSAMAICLPAFICLRLLAWTESGLPPNPAHSFALDLISFAIGWCGFAGTVAPVGGCDGAGAALAARDRAVELVQCGAIPVAGGVLCPRLVGSARAVGSGSTTRRRRLGAMARMVRFPPDTGHRGHRRGGLVTLDVAIGILLAALGVAAVST